MRAKKEACADWLAAGWLVCKLPGFLSYGRHIIGHKQVYLKLRLWNYLLVEEEQEKAEENVAFA